MTERGCVFLPLCLSIFVAVSGRGGEVKLWVAEGLVIILTVQGCLGFLYGATWEQRKDMRKGEQPLHEAVLMDL